MGRRKTFTPEQELAICEMYERVERTVPVAEAFKVSAQTICRVLKKYGIPRTHRHPKEKSGAGSNHKGIDRAKVGELYQSGMSVGEIAKAMGCKSSAIYYHLDKLGLYEIGQRKANVDALVPQIMELHKQGLSDYEIASKLGIGRYAVGYRLQKAGIHRGKGFVSPRESVCERCGKTFVATKKNQIYCSKTCNNAVCSMRRNDAKRVGVDEVETITLREVWERDHGRCYLCGRKTDWNDYRTVNGWRVTGPRYPSRDHVIALSNGGTHTRDNIRLACFECNANKNNHGQLRLAV